MITRRARGGPSRVTLLASIPLLALIALAAGCGTVHTPPAGSGGPATASPAPVPTTTGGTVTPGQPACTGWPAKVSHGTLPATFVPVAVLQCVTGEQTVPGKGQWETATLERADTNLAALTAALRRPAGRTSPGMMCPQVELLPPQIVLVSGDGTMIIPQIPAGDCGLPEQQVLTALAALHWQKVSVHLVSQVRTQQEVASGCAAESSDPFTAYGSLRPSAGGALYSTAPAALRICVYSVSGATTSAAQLVEGTTVTGKTESDLLASLSGTRSASLCTLPRSMFAVIGADTAGAPVIYVELGGCDRTVRYDSGTEGMMGVATGEATPGAVAMIESVTLRGDEPPIATVPLTPQVMP